MSGATSPPHEDMKTARDGGESGNLFVDCVDDEGADDSDAMSEHIAQLADRLDLTTLPTVKLAGLPDDQPRNETWESTAPFSSSINLGARQGYIERFSSHGGPASTRMSARGSHVGELDTELSTVRDFSVEQNNQASSADGRSPETVRQELTSYLKIELPSDHLAERSSKSPEVTRAVGLLAKAMLSRKKFVVKWRIHLSKAVKPAVRNPNAPWASREPRFEPWDVEPPKNIDGKVEMSEGVLQIYVPQTESELVFEVPKNGSPTCKFGERIEEEKISTLSSCSSSSTTSGLVVIPGIKMIPTLDQFLDALTELMLVVQEPACKSLAFQRLKFLRERFALHLLFNGAQESSDVQTNSHRDFYNVRKVDTHVHHSACMTQKHLLRFIRHKYRTEAGRVVGRDGEGNSLTLSDIFEKDLGITAYDATVDHLNVHAINSCFHRFDLFNSKYNPFGAAALREIFLKTDNDLGGLYLAEITKEVIADLERAKYQHVEWRISIYGHSPDEWLKLARWVKSHDVRSKNVRWIIQVPRLYHIYKKRGKLNSMGDFLRNVFGPVAEAILRPRDHPEIFEMLLQTVAWDSVDDESVMSKFTTAGAQKIPRPHEWTRDENPPYAYFSYYMYANIRAINHLLQARGMNAMPYRPHCGEAGSISHVATCGLLAEGINHGIMLRKTPVLEYLYYLWQIGLALSPLSNNALFHEITKSPFEAFFKIGLNVSLSTDDPLLFHFTDEALLEEYSVCAHIWKLSPVDLCEIARNSVLQSNFETQFKEHWLGQKYWKRGPRGNNVSRTNVPDLRLAYREDTLKDELKFLRDVLLLSNNEALF